MHAKTPQPLLLLAISCGVALAAPQGWGFGCSRWKDCDDGKDIGYNSTTHPPTTVMVMTTITITAPIETITAPAGTFTVPPQLQQPPSPPPSALASASILPPWPSASPASSPDEDAEPAGWQPIAAKWRAKLGLVAWTVNDTLVANALKTATDGDGAMVHQLGPGSMAQVLAPGNETAAGFENALVGGWLCELRDLPGLEGACPWTSSPWIWVYDGQTDHAEILSSPAYTRIGCAWFRGIWACDLGY